MCIKGRVMPWAMSLYPFGAHIHAFNGRTIFPTDRADGTDFSHAVCSFPIDEGKEKTGALAYDARSPVFIPNVSVSAMPPCTHSFIIISLLPNQNL